MPFAPHEIENKRFVAALRGYQTDEVEGFLRAIAADYKALLEQVDSVTPDRWMSDMERLMSTASGEAAEIRAAAVAEAAAIREAAERDAAELRAATQQEAEACFAEITRQAEELHRLESALWNRMHALEHAVVEARQTLAHVSDIYPMPTLGTPTNGGDRIAARYPASAAGELSTRMIDGPEPSLVQLECQ
jgi:DivIVA domain-containing protein